MQTRNLTLKYKTDSHFSRQNEKDFKAMTEMLSSFGVTIREDAFGTVTISLQKEQYDSFTKRKAGRKRNLIVNPETGSFYRYSDVYRLLLSHTDEEVWTKLHLSRATYFRRKKSMTDSTYGKMIKSGTPSGAPELSDYDFYF